MLELSGGVRSLPRGPQWNAVRRARPAGGPRQASASRWTRAAPAGAEAWRNTRLPAFCFLLFTLQTGKCSEPKRSRFSRLEVRSCQGLLQNSGAHASRERASLPVLLILRWPRKRPSKDRGRGAGASVRRDAEAKIGGADEIDHVAAPLPARNLHQRGQQVGVEAKPVRRTLHRQGLGRRDRDRVSGDVGGAADVGAPQVERRSAVLLDLDHRNALGAGKRRRIQKQRAAERERFARGGRQERDREEGKHEAAGEMPAK